VQYSLTPINGSSTTWEYMMMRTTRIVYASLTELFFVLHNSGYNSRVMFSAVVADAGDGGLHW
jgi:hypothetical protein